MPEDGLTTDQSHRAATPLPSNDRFVTPYSVHRTEYGVPALRLLRSTTGI